MNFRTDLAVEAAPQGDLDTRDVTQNHRVVQGVTVTRTRVLTPHGEAELGKPRGQYITISLPPLTDDETALHRHGAVVGRELAALLPPEGTVLVVGLGNRSVTPDALGPATTDLVLATRHIEGEFARAMGLNDLRPVAVVAPGVLGQTGTESSELVRGVCREIHPSAVVVVDALAAGRVERLGCTVQLCNTGIAPGSGVGNNRRPLNREVLGVPVIGVGVPTVVDAATMVAQMSGEEVAPEQPPMMVTPREIDLMIARAARLLAYAIHTALQPKYAPLDLSEVARGI